MRGLGHNVVSFQQSDVEGRSFSALDGVSSSIDILAAFGYIPRRIMFTVSSISDISAFAFTLSVGSETLTASSGVCTSRNSGQFAVEMLQYTHVNWFGLGNATTINLTPLAE